MSVLISAMSLSLSLSLAFPKSNYMPSNGVLSSFCKLSICVVLRIIHGSNCILVNEISHTYQDNVSVLTENLYIQKSTKEYHLPDQDKDAQFLLFHM